jgi:hypothetical protein
VTHTEADKDGIEIIDFFGSPILFLVSPYSPYHPVNPASVRVAKREQQKQGTKGLCGYIQYYGFLALIDDRRSRLWHVGDGFLVRVKLVMASFTGSVRGTHGGLISGLPGFAYAERRGERKGLDVNKYAWMSCCSCYLALFL